VIPFRTKTEDAGYHSQAEADIDYGVLMHPPVAVALADLLTCISMMPSASDPTDRGVAEALAREILRESQ
jgi:hypothetical protein